MVALPLRRADLIVRVTLPALVLLLDGWLPALAAALVQEIGLWLAPRMADGWHHARRLYLASLALRGALAVALHTYFLATRGHGAVFQDDHTYDLVAHWLVRMTLGGEGLSVFTGYQHLLENPYAFAVTGLYTLIGYAPLVPKVINVVLGALCAVLIADLALRAFGTRHAVLAGLVAALLPTLVFWSTVTLKEMAVLFGTLLALRSLVHLAQRRPARQASAALLLVVGIALAEELRVATFLTLLALVPVAGLVRAAHVLRPWHIAVGAVAVVAVAVVGLSVVSARFPDSLVGRMAHPDDFIRTINYRRAREALAARSQFAGSDASLRDVLDIPAYRETSALNAMADVVQPLAFSLLAPAPWQVRTLRDAAASAEMLLWYALLLGCLAFWRAPPIQWGTVVVLGLYGLATWTMLGLGEGNLGNLLRHRIMLTPPLVALGAPGLLALWEWSRARRARGGGAVRARLEARTAAG